jgi:hypothetical protein
MSSPSLALQKAIYDALKGNTAAGDNVFDAVPSSNPFPRIVIGLGQTVGDSFDCYDGSEVFPEVDVYSVKTGLPEAKTIADEVRSLLHNVELALAGHVLVSLRYRDETPIREPDGRTSRVRMLFEAETYPS